MSKRFFMNSSDGVKKEQFKHFLYYDKAICELPQGVTAKDFSDCLCFMKYGSNVSPIIKVSVKRDNKYLKKDILVGGYKELLKYMLKHKNEKMLFVAFSRATMARIFRNFLKSP